MSLNTNYWYLNFIQHRAAAERVMTACGDDLRQTLATAKTGDVDAAVSELVSATVKFALFSRIDENGKEIKETPASEPEGCEEAEESAAARQQRVAAFVASFNALESAINNLGAAETDLVLLLSSGDPNDNPGLSSWRCLREGIATLSPFIEALPANKKGKVGAKGDPLARSYVALAANIWRSHTGKWPVTTVNPSTSECTAALYSLLRRMGDAVDPKRDPLHGARITKKSFSQASILRSGKAPGRPDRGERLCRPGKTPNEPPSGYSSVICASSLFAIR